MRRGLTREETALWRRVAATVTPLDGAVMPDDAGMAEVAPPPAPATTPPRRKAGRVPPPLMPPPARPASSPDRHPASRTLDSTWDRKLAQGRLSPDFTLDLHGHSLDAAHARLDHGLAQAIAMGARVVLLVTGRPRPHDDHAGRGERRGAIRAKFADWIAHGAHGSKIAAIRPAHPRHGGAGAVYIVLRRPR